MMVGVSLVALLSTGLLFSLGGNYVDVTEARFAVSITKTPISALFSPSSGNLSFSVTVTNEAAIDITITEIDAGVWAFNSAIALDDYPWWFLDRLLFTPTVAEGNLDPGAISQDFLFTLGMDFDEGRYASREGFLISPQTTYWVLIKVFYDIGDFDRIGIVEA